jgi:ATP-dependent DNA helicase PIF1
VPALPPSLSDEQQAVLDLALAGHSLFLTGSAGTGKSFLLSRIVDALKGKYGEEAVYVTATTGVAAVNVDGCTIHSYAGFGLGKGHVFDLLVPLRRKRDVVERWTKTRVLVIDELSMMSDDMFDKLELIGRRLRGRELEPFGGIQVIGSGDFYQLPPVPDPDSPPPRMCFRASSWSSVFTKQCLLTRIYRQTDRAFVDVLNEVRAGRPTLMSLAYLAGLQRPLPLSGKVEPTVLYPHRADVSSMNDKRLAALPGPERVYKARDWAIDNGHLVALEKHCTVAPVLTLKVGAQVVLLRNLCVKGGLVNGSRGVVTSMDERGPTVDFVGVGERLCGPTAFETKVGSRLVACRTQVPLGLAWALTIHKSQGMSIDLLEVALGSVFEDGQAYTALSRARRPSGLRLLDDPTKARITASKEATAFYASLSPSPGCSSSSSSSSSQDRK